MSSKDYFYRLSTKTDIPDLLHLLYTHFYPNEFIISNFFAVNKGRFSSGEILASRNYLITRCRIRLEREPCLLAIHPTSEMIAGAAILQVEENPSLFSKPSQQALAEIFKSSMHPRARVAEFFEHVVGSSLMDEKFNVFREYPNAERALNLVILCVNRQHQRRGLATALVRKSLEWGKEEGFNVMHGLFTSPLSAKAAGKNGFRKHAEVDILSFKDKEGKQVYDGLESRLVYLMAKEI